MKWQIINLSCNHIKILNLLFVILQTWQDTRSATKTKAAAIKRHIGGTGGGPTCAIQLNDIQQDALLLMSPASVSGHSKSKESNVEFIYEITENDVTLGKFITNQFN